MLQVFQVENYTDGEGNPAGGYARSQGIGISWQNGPLGRGADRKEPNGAFVETVIAIAKDRLEFYQRSRFNCEENAEAIDYLDQALDVLHKRTVEREKREVEGTHAV